MRYLLPLLFSLPLASSSPSHDQRPHRNHHNVKVDTEPSCTPLSISARSPAIPDEAQHPTASAPTIPEPPLWLEYAFLWMTCGPGAISCAGPNSTCASDLRCLRPDVFKTHSEVFKPVPGADTSASTPTPVSLHSTPVATPVASVSLVPVAAGSAVPSKPINKPHVYIPQAGDMNALAGPQLTGWGPFRLRSRQVKAQTQSSCPLMQCTSNRSCGANARCLRGYCVCGPNHRSVSTASGRKMLLPNLAAVYVTAGVGCNVTCTNADCGEVPTGTIRGCFTAKSEGNVKGETKVQGPPNPAQGKVSGNSQTRGQADVQQYDQLGKPVGGHGAINQPAPGPGRLL